MPVYNAGHYLDAAIRSIRSQTMHELEFIVVDDGSTDGSALVMEQHAAADPRISVHRLPHGGIARALNHGLAAARANFVACMNADDLAAPERLARQAEYLEAHPEMAVLGAAAELIDADGRVLACMAPETDSAGIRAHLLEANLLIHPTVMMRREVVLAAGGYRPIFTAAEDYDLWLRLSDRHELGNMAEVLLSYRSHAGQATARRQRICILEVLAAQHATRLRRSGRADPLWRYDRIDARTLRAIGIRPAAIATALDGTHISAPPLEPDASATRGKRFLRRLARHAGGNA